MLFWFMYHWAPFPLGMYGSASTTRLSSECGLRLELEGRPTDNCDAVEAACGTQRWGLPRVSNDLGVVVRDYGRRNYVSSLRQV
jgi:hypothetical protein